MAIINDALVNFYQGLQKCETCSVYYAAVKTLYALCPYICPSFPYTDKTKTD